MRPFLYSAVLLLFFAPTAVIAQLALPGAVVAPTPEGQSMTPDKPRRQAPGGAHKAHGSGSGEHASSGPAIKPKPPAESAVIGQTFGLNGTRGAMTVEKADDGLRVTRLVLSGAKVSHPNQSCEVAMGEDGPIKLKALGAPDGASRHELQASACPMLVDVLGGALRVSTPFGACAFFAADCRADVAGLWGPPGGAFAEKIKTFDRERAGLEKSVQARFRDLLKRYKKQPDLARQVVKEQADFGAARAQTCRDYDKEETHGFCALRLTEARDLALQARLAEAGEAKETERDAKKTVAKKSAPKKPAVKRAPAPAAPPPPQPGMY